MAACEDYSDTSSEEVLMNYEFFMHNFQVMINWEDKDWIANVKDSNEFEFTVKNLRYWAKALKPAMNETTILFALYKNGKLITLGQRFWIDFLKSINAIEYFENFYQVRNNFITGMQVTSAEAKEFIIEKLKVIENGYVIDLDWYNLIGKVELRVHWIPRGFHEEELKHKFAEFVEVEEFGREDIKEEDGIVHPSSVISIRGILRKDSIEVIPHLIVFRGLQALIVIRGRRPMCLKCENIGHKAFECKMYHCVSCRIMHDKSFVCGKREERKKTFAEKVKGTAGIAGDCQEWPMINDNFKKKGGGVIFVETASVEFRAVEKQVDVLNSESNLEIKKNKKENKEVLPKTVCDKKIVGQTSSSLMIDAEQRSEEKTEGEEVKEESMEIDKRNQKRPRSDEEDSENSELKVNIKDNKIKTYGASRYTVVTENRFDSLVADDESVFD